MKKLDLDILHCEGGGRNSGRTTRMLVEAIQNADFLPEDQAVVHVFAHSMGYAKELARQAAWVATELGFEKVKLIGGNRLDVNGRMFLFHTTKDAEKLVSDDECIQNSPRVAHFADHFLYEVNRD